MGLGPRGRQAEHFGTWEGNPLGGESQRVKRGHDP